jgi:hypothetical protein
MVDAVILAKLPMPSNDEHSMLNIGNEDILEAFPLADFQNEIYSVPFASGGQYDILNRGFIKDLTSSELANNHYAILYHYNNNKYWSVAKDLLYYT